MSDTFCRRCRQLQSDGIAIRPGLWYCASCWAAIGREQRIAEAAIPRCPSCGKDLRRWLRDRERSRKRASPPGS